MHSNISKFNGLVFIAAHFHLTIDSAAFSFMLPSTTCISTEGLTKPLV